MRQVVDYNDLYDEWHPEQFGSRHEKHKKEF